MEIRTPSIVIAPLDSFTVMGMTCVTSKAQERKSRKIVKLFSDFSARSSEIRHTVKGRTFGISLYPKGFTGFEEYEYLAGYQVTDSEEIPEGMSVHAFPAHQYAVITHKGDVLGLYDTYSYFHSVWLPASGYEYADLYDLQVYDSRFLGPDHPESEMDVYIPIRPIRVRACSLPGGHSS